MARVAAQYRNDLPSPYRRYAMGPVWRNEKPGPGRFRQFYQCDADTVGSGSVAADAEICAMLSDALEEVGIPRGDYVIKVNNRKVLNGVMEVAGVLDPSDPEKFAEERGIVLRAIDKFDRLGRDGVKALLGAGRLDDSGDFTKGANLDGRCDCNGSCIFHSERRKRHSYFGDAAVFGWRLRCRPRRCPRT